MSILSQVQVLIRGVQKYYANALDDEIHEDLVVIFNELLEQSKKKHPDNVFAKNIRPVDTSGKIKNFVIKLDLLEDMLKDEEALP